MPASRRPDHKAEKLRQHGALNSAPEDVRDDLFHASDFFDARDLVQVKYEMLRRARRDGWPVARSARSYGLSRPTFYSAKAAFEGGGLAGLVPRKRGPHSAYKLTDEVLAFVERLRTKDGTISAAALAERIATRFGVTVHPRSIERALLRREKKRR